MRPMLLFDAECALCSWSVRFVLRHERGAALLFVSMQSETGRRVLAEHGFDPERAESFVLIDNGRAWIRSDAAVRVCRYLRRPWRWGRVLGLVPRWLRDSMYGFVSRHRYRVFGRVDRCSLDDRLRGREVP